MTTARMKAELADDLTWSRSRPAVVRFNAGKTTPHITPYQDALTEFETKSLAAYRSSWPGMACSLSQNGATGFAMHSTDHCLHTFIRNLGLVWSDVLADSPSDFVVESLFIFVWGELSI